jgi:hypothetical protein
MLGFKHLRVWRRVVRNEGVAEANVVFLISIKKSNHKLGLKGFGRVTRN